MLIITAVNIVINITEGRDIPVNMTNIVLTFIAEDRL